MNVLWLFHFSILLLNLIATAVQQPGVCALYGQCGKQSLFGKELPCDANVNASKPNTEELKLLEEVCGWQDVDLVCCDQAQLLNMKEQLAKLSPLIASCPACKQNFYQFFCQFTCSPDQSTFVNVTKTGTSTSGQTVVTELDEFVLGEYASKFFDSCKNIKFSATNGYAMDLIGGGAKNYQQFLKFLGDAKPLLGGSPIQMNYKYEPESNFELLNVTAYDCNDKVYKCACPDCQDACPAVPDIQSPKQCRVGILPCFSFAVIMVYSLLLILISLLYYYKIKNQSSPLFLDSFHTEHGDDEAYDTGADDEDEDDGSEYDLTAAKGYPLNDYIGTWFGKLGFNCALYPKTVISVALVLSLILSSLTIFIKLETNPVNLWVSDQAELYKQKQHFDENFGPFYRTQQIFLVNESGPILQTYDTLKWWFEREKEITQLMVYDQHNERPIGLTDLCFLPLGDSCVIESFTQYFHGDIAYFPDEKTYLSKLKSCMDSPVTCLPEFQQPLNKNLLFGGFEEDALNASAIVVTLLLNNEVDQQSDNMLNAAKWELLLQSYLLELQDSAEMLFDDIRISFNTETSLEKELNKSTNTDVKIVIISYFVMFAYASLALGGTIPGLSPRSWIKTKFSLGLIGIFIVLISVLSSAGICAAFGVKSTLIIAEVIPFLVLAVGVDNIFLITNDFKKTSLELPLTISVEDLVGITLSKIGPSILLSSFTQFLCFALASAVSMPAVHNFSLYCAGAVLINALLQLTCFVSVLSLDEKRTRDNRLDIFPFKKVNRVDTSDEHGIVPQLLKDNESESFFFHRIIKNHYAPFVLSTKIKPYICLVFVCWLGISLSALPNIQLGLDQRIAIPSDSFLVDYFTDIYSYLGVGPPIYLVVDDLNVTQTENQQKLCGRFAGCNQYSLGNILEQEYNKEDGFIADPLSSWLDDFFLWLNPDMDECCRVKKTNNDEFCLPNAPSRPCEACYLHKEYEFSDIGSFPHGQEFLNYFSNWIESPSDPCPLGGKLPYSSSIVPNYKENTISSSTFRTSHLPLRSQNDFIAAYKNSLKLVDMIKELTGIENVYAYSPFYIFFVQYETITSLTFTLVLIALLLIFVASAVLLGSLRVAAILVVTVISILINIGGIMAIWDISLNAVSLVNLIICIGLAVEFCVHIARGYVFIDRHIDIQQSGKNESSKRAYHTLISIGGSVFGGITMTKFIGVLVLAFTRSKIFEVYYFRMWLSLVLVLSLHSLVLLPILLSYLGGSGYFLKQGDAIVGDNLISRLRGSYIYDDDDDE